MCFMDLYGIVENGIFSTKTFFFFFVAGSSNFHSNTHSPALRKSVQDQQNLRDVTHMHTLTHNNSAAMLTEPV